MSKRSFPKSYSIIVSSLLAVMILASCNLPGPVFPTPIPIIQTPVTPQITDTPQAPPVPPAPPAPVETTTPSFTPSPTFTITPFVKNILFATGTTAAVEQGTVQPGQTIPYTLSAGQSQPMMLIMESPHGDVTLGVFEQDGTTLLDPAKKWTNWQWLLPKTEVYTIQVIGGATSESYTLTAKVAQLVHFASGATTITIPGTTAKGYIFSYSLNCKAGQTMSVSLNVPSSTAYLDVFGIATGVLLSATTHANSWTGVLPATQAYIIEVIPNNGQVVNYSLTVTVP